MSMSKGTMIGLAAGAVVLGGLVYVLTRSPVSKSAASAKKSEQTPKLSLETTVKIFERITQQMQVTVISLAEHEQKLRQAAAQRGRSLPDADLEQYLLGEFRKAMGAVEQAVYDEFSTSEDDVRIATQHYQEDPDLKQTLEKLKAIFRAVTGAPPASETPLPDHLTMEKTIELMAEILESSSSLVEALYMELAEAGMTPSSEDFKMEMQKRYVDGFPKMKKEIHAKHEINEEHLQGAVVKYQQIPLFQKQIFELSQAHRDRLEKAGFQ